jgi:hypothetical protein
MKRIAPYFAASILTLLILSSCKKDPVKKDDGPQEPPASSALKGPVTLYLTDYYPDSFYHRYAQITVTSDTNNLYLHFNSLNDFTFKKLKIVVGSFAHVKGIIYPYSNPPLSDVGPSSSDYQKEYTTDQPSTNDFTIKRSTLGSNPVYIYAWAYLEKYHADGTLGDWHPSWVYTKEQMNNDAATSYFGYSF